MKITAYRIFKTKHSANWADGEGAFQFGGRWNSPGGRVVYASQSLSLAALEMLVNLNSAELLLSYSFATLEFDELLVIDIEKIQTLPKNWHDSPPPTAVQRIGDGWISSQKSAIIKVPSAVVQGEPNYVFNVEHRNFAEVKLGEPARFVFDNRLRK